MSDLETRPAEHTSAAPGSPGPEVLLLDARKVWLGRTTRVSRALPHRDIRMIGAWCFLDHYGPEDVRDRPGMQVWAHPHTGLQTVSWLLEGEIEHRDSVGSRVTVRPGELNLMTAGHGIVHSELSPPDHPPTLHGVQLWLALPGAHRDAPPAFDTYADLPRLDRPGLRGQVLVGTLDQVTAPTRRYSPVAGADLTLDPGASVELAVDPGYEYGLLVVAGSVGVGHPVVGSTDAQVDQLLYLGCGRRTLTLQSASGGRAMLLGGAPFEEEIVMWWNFIGRSHQEVVAYREAWVRRDPRFPPVVSLDERVMGAPDLPSVALRSRPHRRPAR